MTGRKKKEGPADIAKDGPDGSPVEQPDCERTEAEPVQGAAEPPEVPELRRQLAEKDELAKAYFAQLQRVQADFENYQKRMDADRSRIADNACEAMIAGLLDTLDNFERAVSHLERLPDESAKGVVMVYRALLSYLRENGLERIEAAGCQFDPRRHEAIMQAEDADSPDGTVLEEFQTGYSVRGRVVRPTKVKVCRRPAKANEISTDEKKEE